jgi:hypothetical protein
LLKVRWKQFLSFKIVKNVTNSKIETLTPDQIGRLKRHVPANRAMRPEKRKIANASFAAVAALYDWSALLSLTDSHTRRLFRRSRQRMRLL